MRVCVWGGACCVSVCVCVLTEVCTGGGGRWLGLLLCAGFVLPACWVWVVLPACSLWTAVLCLPCVPGCSLGTDVSLSALQNHAK